MKEQSSPNETGFSTDELIALRKATEVMAEALRDTRKIVPEAMKAVMYQGRDGLILAHSLHNADDLMRTALAAYEATK